MGEELLNEKDKLSIEIHSAISHGIGAILGVVFLLMLIIPRIREGDVLGTVAFSIYGGCFIFMFLMSTLYHGVQQKKAKKVLRVFDHVSIYFLIAGSFTPAILLLTDGAFRIFFISLIWGIAALGTVFKIVTFDNYDDLKKISTIIYVAMGWLSIFLIKPILRESSWKFLAFLILGGVIYTAGTYFYKSNKFKYHHVIWHFFVLAAAIVHFIAFYLYV